MSTLQTLDRGLRVLELLAESPAGLSITALSDALGVHKAVTYRLVATLEARGLVRRGGEGRVALGGGVMALAAQFEPQFRAAAAPLLRDLARQTRAAAFMSVAQGDSCVAILVEDADQGVLRVGYRLGSRHPLTRGASGQAILAGRPPRPDEPEAVTRARAQGFAATRGELQTGAVGVASPVLTPQMAERPLEPCVGVVAMADLDIAAAAPAVQDCAAALRRLLAPETAHVAGG